MEHPRFGKQARGITSEQRLINRLANNGLPFQAGETKPGLVGDDFVDPNWANLDPDVLDGVVALATTSEPVRVILGDRKINTGKTAASITLDIPSVGYVSLGKLPGITYDVPEKQIPLPLFAFEAQQIGAGQLVHQASLARRRSKTRYTKKIKPIKTFPKSTLENPSQNELLKEETPFEKLTPHFDAIYADPFYIPGRIIFIEGNSVSTLANAQEIRNYLTAHQSDCQPEDARTLIGNAIEANRRLAEMNPKNKLLANRILVYERIKDAFFTWTPLAELGNGIPMALACEIGFEELYIREIRASLIQTMADLWQGWNETPDGQRKVLSMANSSWFKSFCFYYPEKIGDIYNLLKENFKEIKDVSTLLKFAPYTSLAKQLKSLLVIGEVDFQDTKHTQALFERIVASLRELKINSDQPMVRAYN